MGAQRVHLALESGLHGDLLLDLGASFDRPVEEEPHPTHSRLLSSLSERMSYADPSPAAR